MQKLRLRQNLADTLIAIETATQGCSAALFHQGKMFTRFQITEREHTQLILPMIDALIKEADVSLSQVEAIAVGRGPGSFTGVRIAVSVAKGLSYGLKIPIYPISTLEALAYQAAVPLTKKILILSAIDARMQQMYGAIYEWDQNVLHCIEAEQLFSYAEWESKCKENKGIISTGYPRAEDILRIALQQRETGKLGVTAQAMLPVYIRDKVVQ